MVFKYWQNTKKRLDNDMDESFDGVADAVQKAFARKIYIIIAMEMLNWIDLDEEEYKSSSDEE